MKDGVHFLSDSIFPDAISEIGNPLEFGGSVSAHLANFISVGEKIITDQFVLRLPYDLIHVND